MAPQDPNLHFVCSLLVFLTYDLDIVGSICCFSFSCLSCYIRGFHTSVWCDFSLLLSKVGDELRHTSLIYLEWYRMTQFGAPYLFWFSSYRSDSIKWLNFPRSGTQPRSILVSFTFALTPIPTTHGDCCDSDTSNNAEDDCMYCRVLVPLSFKNYHDDLNSLVMKSHSLIFTSYWLIGSLHANPHGCFVYTWLKLADEYHCSHNPYLQF